MSNNNGTIYEKGHACADVPCMPPEFCIEDDDMLNCRISCIDPGALPNGSRIPSVRDPPLFSPEEVIIFTCEHNKAKLQVKCRADGNWSHPKPTCYDEGESPVTTSMTDSPPSGVSGGVLAIGLLSVFALIAVAVILFLYFTRCRRRQSQDKSHPVVQESNFPLMPDNLNDEAVSINDFGQHVAIRHNNADHLFHEEFEEIQNQPTAGYSCETSFFEDNQDKNRYTNIVAYDHSRVRLNRGKRHRNHSGSTDYINANFVSSYERPKAYIACQGPLPGTFVDFWKMVWDNNVSIIVMITNLVEKGRRKCDQYWPRDGREEYKQYAVTLRDEDVYANYTVRTFQLRDMKQNKRRSYNNDRRILQYHYTQWPDHGTPEYILPLLTFIRRSSHTNTDLAPIVVHCSAGVGRTGAYIMLHSMIKMAELTGKVNVNRFLRFIRTQRIHLVQTEDQYVFLFDALLCHFICGNSECPARQLKNYVETLTKPTEIKKISNGTSEKGGPKQLDTVKGRTGMENQFMIVARQVTRDIDYDFAKRKVNEHKNRPDGILPIFRSRVSLNYRIGSEGSDYINASFLQGYRSCKLFIVTQLPMANTRKDFWNLVWDHNCSVIITIRDKKWNDKEDVYWPTAESQISCPLFNISSGQKTTEWSFGQYKIITRTFLLEATKDDYVLNVTQVDINCWPTLEDLDPNFTKLLNLIVKTTDNKDSSIIIHDRFGGTAAGQLVCAHTLKMQLANENAVDVFQTVRVAHQMRPGMFKSHKDLHFLYKAMLLETNPLQNGGSAPVNQTYSDKLEDSPSSPSESALLIGSRDEPQNEIATTESTKSSILPDDSMPDDLKSAETDTHSDSNSDDSDGSHYDLINEIEPVKNNHNEINTDNYDQTKDTYDESSEDMNVSATTQLLA